MAKNKAVADPITFDLAEALAGRTYPTDTVNVFLDEHKMYVLSKALMAASQDPGSVDKENEVSRLMEEFRSEAYIVTIRGVDPELVNAIMDELNEEFPLVSDAFGRFKMSSERAYAFQRRLWSLYVIEIKDPKGAVISPPTEEHLAMFRNKAPEAAIKAVDDAIETMRAGTEAAYKTTVSDLAFLSKR